MLPKDLQTPDQAFNWRSIKLSPALHSLTKKLNFKEPTAIQFKGIPAILSRVPVLLHSHTGSGKTLAFSLPLLDALYKDPKGIFGLVILPSREVAIQVAQTIEFYGNGNVRVATAVGGVDYQAQKRSIEDAPHVLVGTPGRLCEQLQSSEKARKYLRNMEFLVLDEADRLLEPSLFVFVKQILQIIQELPNNTASRIQSIFSTATVGSDDISAFQTLPIVTKPIKVVNTNEAQQHAKTVSLKYIQTPDQIKDSYLLYLLTDTFQGNDIIVFTNSCQSCHLLWRTFQNLSSPPFSSVALHSYLEQKARSKALSLFRNKQANVFITTDICSRGIDVKAVDVVINYDLPRDHTDFIHRVGRTARGGRRGLALSLLTQYDLKRLKNIEEGLGERLEEFEKFDEENAIKNVSQLIKAKKKAEYDISKNGEDEIFERIQKRKKQFRKSIMKDQSELKTSSSNLKSLPSSKQAQVTKLNKIKKVKQAIANLKSKKAST